MLSGLKGMPFNTSASCLNLTVLALIADWSCSWPWLGLTYVARLCNAVHVLQYQGSRPMELDHHLGCSSAECAFPAMQPNLQVLSLPLCVRAQSTPT